MRYPTWILLCLFTACCNAAPQSNEEAHERFRRENYPTNNFWWLPGSTPGTHQTSRIINCAHPGTPRAGTSQFESLAAGSLVVHSCNPGYKLVGAKLRLCQSNGQWTPQLPQCTYVDCGDPGEPANGSKWVGATSLGSIVKYRCDTGYQLVGKNFRVCEQNGVWGGSLPTCAPPPCAKLTMPMNGRVTIRGQGTSAQATYQCNTGFTLIGSRTRDCRNGVWLGTAPTCQTITCPILPDIEFGSVLVSSSSVGSVARYICNAGFELIGSSSRTCQANGAWSDEEPECKEVGCSLLSAPRNGAVGFSETTVGSQAFYSCNSGFVLVGDRVRVCLAGGRWSNEVPVCQVIDCGTLNSPRDGQVLLTGTTLNSVATYTCNSGFDLIGSSERVCQIDSDWSNEAPTCRVRGCAKLNNPSAGQVFLTGTAPGSLATYICNPGFRLEGVRNRVCQNSGEWSDEEPTCIMSNCGRLDNPENGQVTVSGLSPGSVARYSCQPGFELTGVATRVCLQTQEWSGTAPICTASALLFAFSQLSSDVGEEDEVATVVIELTLGTVTSQTDITLSTSSLSAVDSADTFGCLDYTSTSETVSFPAGSTPGTQRTVSIPINNDNCVERTETFRVTATSTDPDVTFLNGDSSTVSIQDNDTPLYRFTEPSYTFDENNSPAQAAIELFSDTVLTFPAIVRVVDVPGGSATDGVDYIGVSVNVVFPTGSSQGTTVPFDIFIIDDQLAEEDETILLQASTNEPGEVPSEIDQSTVVIIDNDFVEFAFTEDTYDVNEGDKVVLVTVELTNSILDKETPITISTDDITANVIDEFGCFDYESTSETVRFPAGSTPGTQITVSIPINEDNCVERAETFRVTASSTDLDITFPNGDSSTVSIQDNDTPLYRFTELSYTVNENNSPAQPAIELFSDTVLTFPAIVRVIDVPGGSATDEVDYSGVSVIVRFLAGSRQGTEMPFNIPIIDDQLVEENETILLQASTDEPGEVPPETSGRDQATVIIIDNDMITCERLLDITNGIVVISGVTVGSAAVYRCNTGFILVGEDTRRCQESGVWSGREPFCTPAGCDRLENPENGRVDLTGTQIGSLATYLCFPGFSLIGEQSRSCLQSGQWSGNIPICEAITCPNLSNIPNGQVLLTGNTVGSRATYSCVSGFGLAGVSPRICQPNGQWSGGIPSCQPASCPDLRQIPNGVIQTTGMQFGDTATYNCVSGFMLQGIQVRTCQANGFWSGAEPFCQAIQCPFLDSPENGQVTLRGTTAGSQAIYNCFPGFILSGVSSRTCQENGVWSDTAPTCTAIRCETLVDPVNGQVTVTGTTFNSLAIYSCNEGFNLVGSTIRRCMASGQWSAQAPTCASQMCSQLESPQNGRVNINGFTPGSLANYTCFPGFNLVGQNSRACQPNGVWSGSTPFCQGITCDVLNAPQNGRVSLTGTQVRDTASYECLSGFLLQGVRVRECQPNGSWSLQEPVCTAIDCGSLSAPENGDLVLSGTTFRSTARYSCDSGFGLVGTSIRTCEASGEWSATAPICQIAQCPDLDPPANGNIETTGMDFWDTATYTCNSGFNLVGVSTRTCQANGAWSGSPPFCTAIQCPALQPPKDGQVQFTSTTFGALAIYRCHVGFVLNGNEERTCQADSSWSGSTPTCTRVTCDLLPLPKNGDIDFSQGTAYGSVATYSCEPPFQLSGRPNRVCLQNGQWSGMAPVCESLECPDLRAPENGDVLQSGSVPGSTATYTCYGGFSLIGDERRICQANGFWTGVGPLCQRAGCDQLSPPSNGDVKVTGLTIGSHATYICDDGFSLVGKEFRSCQNNGEWSGLEPSCQATNCGPLNDPPNGIVELEGTRANDYATYRCNTGFVLFGEGIRKCLPDGTWNGKAPGCREVNCGPLNNPINGFVSFSGTTFGLTARYSCDPGFEIVGFSSRVCEITGSWSGQEPVCAADVCPTLVAPDNGNVEQGRSEYGDTAVYSCNSGFILSGVRIRICLDNGRWSAEAPTCDGVTCPFLQAPVNGRVVLPAGTIVPLSLARYECNLGFILGGNSTRTCGTGGQWSGVEPVCDRVQCETLRDPVNGRVSLSGTSFGSEATYSCFTGYLIGEPETRTCTADGSWSLNTPVCVIEEEFICDQLPDPLNGQVRMTGVTPGSVATYRCNFGHNLFRGNENRRCIDHTGWSGEAPTCEPVSCGSLSGPPNGQVLLFQGITFGASALYSCNQNFLLLGVTRRECQANGEWSLTEPTCSPIECPRLRNPLNGLVVMEGVTVDSIARYSCEQGFSLDGEDTRVCESDGDWSNAAPTCIRIGPIGCGNPGLPTNGHRIGDDFRLGATVYYECNEGYQLVGISSRVCQNTGLWDGFLPSCIAVAGDQCRNTQSYDACGRRCTCVDGQFVDCCRLRVDFASMSTGDKSRLISAIIRVATDPQIKPRYDALVALHKSSFETLAQSTRPSVSQFLPWNRYFMIQYENLLREVDCRITLPYWDWTALPLNPYMSPVFNPVSGFGDSSRSNDSCVNSGPFNFGVFSTTPSAGGSCLQRQYRVQMFPTRAIIEQDILTLSAADFSQFHQFLQIFIHTNVRCFVGGQMCSPNAANDPVYLLHLAQIDFIFDRWQRIDSNRLNVRYANDSTTLSLTDLQVNQFASNDNLADDVCILYDHPNFKSHIPPPMRFLSNALEQMTQSHELKMVCVSDSEMQQAGMKDKEAMKEMCSAE